MEIQKSSSAHLLEHVDETSLSQILDFDLFCLREIAIKPANGNNLRLSEEF